MTKRKLAWAAIIFAAVVALVGIAWTFFGVHEIRMTQAEIQQKIDAKMPHTTKNGVTISNVRLDLADDKIGLALDASATKFHTEYAIGAQTKGTLRYNSAEGSFYFQPDLLKVTRVEANGASVSDKAGKFIDKWVDSKKINDNKAELMATAEEVVQSLVQKSADVVLTRVPVYTLPDNLKGNVVRVFLEDVEVKDGTVIAHLSIWQFTKWVFGFVVVLLIAVGLGIALNRNPEWGVVLEIAAGIGDIGG
jgi:hypothetical protein